MKFRRQLVEGMIRVLLGGVVCATVSCGSSNNGNNGGGGSGGAGSNDKVPPTFAGLTKATVMDDGSIQLAWDPATDNDSKASSIAYAIFSSIKAGAEDFSAPYAF